MERTVEIVLDEIRCESRKIAIDFSQDAEKREENGVGYYTDLSREYEARMRVLESVIRELPREVLERIAE